MLGYRYTSGGLININASVRNAGKSRVFDDDWSAITLCCVVSYSWLCKVYWLRCVGCCESYLASRNAITATVDCVRSIDWDVSDAVSLILLVLMPYCYSWLCEVYWLRCVGCCESDLASPNAVLYELVMYSSCRVAYRIIGGLAFYATELFLFVLSLLFCPSARCNVMCPEV